MCIANGVYCNLGPFSGVYAYQGNTADGKRYYSHNTGANQAVVYVYLTAKLLDMQSVLEKAVVFLM